MTIEILAVTQGGQGWPFGRAAGGHAQGVQQQRRVRHDAHAVGSLRGTHRRAALAVWTGVSCFAYSSAAPLRKVRGH